MVSIAETVEFQIGLFAPTSACTQDITFSQLDVHVRGLQNPFTIQHEADTSGLAKVEQTYHLGDVAAHDERRSADLSWNPGQRKLFNGSISAREEIELSVSR